MAEDTPAASVVDMVVASAEVMAVASPATVVSLAAMVVSVAPML